MSELGDTGVDDGDDDGVVGVRWEKGVVYRLGNQSVKEPSERGRSVRELIFVGSDGNLSDDGVSPCNFTGLSSLQISNLNGTLNFEFIIQPDMVSDMYINILSLLSFIVLLLSILVSFHFCKTLASKFYPSPGGSHKHLDSPRTNQLMQMKLIR